MPAAPFLGAMARKTHFEDLSPTQQRRYIRYGITKAQYERGASLQAARGHKPREHITRYERNPLSLKSVDYGFLRKQATRSKKSLAEFKPQIEAYKKLSLYRRQRLREMVASDHRSYKRAKSRSGVVRGEGATGVAASREVFREVFSAPRGGGGGGAHYNEDEGYDEPDEIEEYEPEQSWDDYEDIFEDFDDELMPLTFYH